MDWGMCWFLWFYGFLYIYLFILWYFILFYFFWLVKRKVGEGRKEVKEVEKEWREGGVVFIGLMVILIVLIFCYDVVVRFVFEDRWWSWRRMEDMVLKYFGVMELIINVFVLIDFLSDDDIRFLLCFVL